MLSLLSTRPTTNEKNGNGRYSTLRKRKRRKKEEKKSAEFSYLKSSIDLTMKFNTSADPIYFAFETLENRSVPELMSDFVKDYFFEITNFVSKVMTK